MMKTLIAAGFTAALMVAAPVSAQSLTTTFAGGNGQNGNMFDILTGGNAITLNSVALHINQSAGATAGLEFYFRPGTMVGNENSAAGWTLFSTNSVVSAGPGVGTTVDIADITFDANTRYGLYFTRSDGSSLNYTNGTGVGDVAAMDSALTVFQGYGKAYAFGATFEPRIINATFNYTPAGAGAVPEPASWALMIAGVGMVGGAMRRRKVATTVSFA